MSRQEKTFTKLGRVITRGIKAKEAREARFKRILLKILARNQLAKQRERKALERLI